MTLICNLPSEKVWVRKEYLTDHQSGHGEFVEGLWVSAKSIPGRAFYFETYLPEYGAMYDKLPISAFVSRPETPDPDLDLPNLQFWNCMDYGVTVLKKYCCINGVGSQNKTLRNIKAHIFVPWIIIMKILTTLMHLQANFLTNISHLI